MVKRSCQHKLSHMGSIKGRDANLRTNKWHARHCEVAPATSKQCGGHSDHHRRARMSDIELLVRIFRLLTSQANHEPLKQISGAISNAKSY